MTRRGRKSSAADLAVINAYGKPPKLTPPPDLREDERALLSELIDAIDARHFRPSDLPLLVSHVQATLMAHSAVLKRDGAHVVCSELGTRYPRGA
jgi:hypothetical protein